MSDQRATRAVPCNGCTACCHKDAIMLHPECGDDAAQYETVPFTNPITGTPGLMIAKKPGTMDCVYLGDSGCTIHDRAPVICREFDCGLMWARWSRSERKQLVGSGMFSANVFKQGYRVQRERGLA